VKWDVPLDSHPQMPCFGCRNGHFFSFVRELFK